MAVSLLERIYGTRSKEVAYVSPSQPWSSRIQQLIYQGQGWACNLVGNAVANQNQLTRLRNATTDKIYILHFIQFAMVTARLTTFRLNPTLDAALANQGIRVNKMTVGGVSDDVVSTDANIAPGPTNTVVYNMTPQAGLLNTLDNQFYLILPGGTFEMNFAANAAADNLQTQLEWVEASYRQFATTRGRQDL